MNTKPTNLEFPMIKDHANGPRMAWIRSGMPRRTPTILERLRAAREAMGTSWIGHPQSTFEWKRGPTVLK